MTLRPQRTYSRGVVFLRNGALRLAAGAVLLVVLLLPSTARAASSSFTIGDQSVVSVWAGKNSEVTIRAWSRPTLQFDTDDESVQVTRGPMAFGTPQNPLSVAIPLQNVKVRDQTGAIIDTVFPPEDFPYSPDFRAGVHDRIRIVTGENSHITVSIPASVAILDARLRGAGMMTIDGYHGSTLFAGDYGGHMVITNVSASAFLQPMHGRLNVTESSFDRLRVRANSAALVFERDRVRQIEVTNLAGVTIWDNGAFDPGLARFESTYGPIAIGAASGALVQARSTDGHVFGLWDRRTPLEARGDNEASATVNGGGPVVNAVSAHGNIFLYDGALASRRVTPPDWRRINTTLRPPEPTPAPASGAYEPAAEQFSPRSNAFARFRAERRLTLAWGRTVPLRSIRRALPSTNGRRQSP
jgi:hypothetical protein